MTPAFFHAEPGSVPCVRCGQAVGPGDADYSRNILRTDKAVCIGCLRALEAIAKREHGSKSSSIQRLQAKVDANPKLIEVVPDTQGTDLHRMALHVQSHRRALEIARGQ